MLKPARNDILRPEVQLAQLEEIVLLLKPLFPGDKMSAGL